MITGSMMLVTPHRGINLILIKFRDLRQHLSSWPDFHRSKSCG